MKILSWVVFAGALVTQAPCWASKPDYSFQGGFSGSFARHTLSPTDPASQRFDFNLEQKFEYGAFKGALGGSFWNESVYVTDTDRYPERLAREDSAEARLRNAYLQYEGSNYFLRLGNQQVVWGEAFGFFYCDIINPKDLRGGGFGDLSDIRLQSPILNTKLILQDFTFQIVLIAQPSFNLLPSPGSDYAIPLANGLPIETFEIRREARLPITSQNQEWGYRIGGLIGQWDLGAFYLNSYDRNPYYTIATESQLPQKLVLQEVHSRIQSYGFTATNDFDGLLVRLEVLQIQDRIVPLVDQTGLTSLKVKDSIYVVGVDLPTFEKWNLNLQWSEDTLSEKPAGLFKSGKQSLASLRIQRPFFRNHNLELLYTHSVTDHGQRAQIDYMAPLSRQLESHWGAELLEGPMTSDFGKLRNASRLFVLFKFFLKG